MINKKFFYTFIVLTIFFLDRITKFWVINIFNNAQKTEIILFPFLNINLIWNEGIAFGLFSFDDKSYYNLLTFLILMVIMIVFFMFLNSRGVERYAFLMIIGGSLGNIFDRLIHSKVPDFIDIHYENYHWFIFNVADIFITIGVFILITNELFLKPKKQI